MIVDQAWVKRNLGFDPLATPAPASTFAFARAATTSPSNEDIQREIIDFDSEAPAGLNFLAFTTATGLSRYTDVPWPKSLAPKTGAAPTGSSSSPLPRADVLVVTWTVDEGHALSRVLTPGKDSRNDYKSYTRNYASISRKMRAGCPAKDAKRLGAYWTTTIGKKKVVVFKSDSHMSQDGPQLPNQDVWKQIIEDVQPQLVITTGTAGGIGKQFEVGDVIVSPIVRFDCTAKFKREPFHDAHYSSSPPNSKYFAKAKTLFKANAEQLPQGQHPAPEDRAGGNDRIGILRRDHRFFRVRHLKQSIQASGTRRCVRDGRRRAGTGEPEHGGQSSSLGRGEERFRSADQGGRHDSETASCAGRADLQRLRPMEFRV